MEKTEKIYFVNNSQHLSISYEKSTSMWTFARNTKSMSLAPHFSISYFSTGSSKVLLFHFLFFVFQVAEKLMVKWKRFTDRQLPFCDYTKTLFAYATGGNCIRNPVMWLCLPTQILQDILIASPVKSFPQMFSLNHLAVSLADDSLLHWELQLIPPSQRKLCKDSTVQGGRLSCWNPGAGRSGCEISYLL